MATGDPIDELGSSKSAGGVRRGRPAPSDVRHLPDDPMHRAVQQSVADELHPEAGGRRLGRLSAGAALRPHAGRLGRSGHHRQPGRQYLLQPARSASPDCQMAFPFFQARQFSEFKEKLLTAFVHSSDLQRGGDGIPLQVNGPTTTVCSVFGAPSAGVFSPSSPAT